MHDNISRKVEFLNVHGYFLFNAKVHFESHETLSIELPCQAVPMHLFGKVRIFWEGHKI